MLAMTLTLTPTSTSTLQSTAPSPPLHQRSASTSRRSLTRSVRLGPENMASKDDDTRRLQEWNLTLDLLQSAGYDVPMNKIIALGLLGRPVWGTSTMTSTAGPSLGPIRTELSISYGGHIAHLFLVFFFSFFFIVLFLDLFFCVSKDLLSSSLPSRRIRGGHFTPSADSVVWAWHPAVEPGRRYLL